jgi:hypothetical protein
MMKRKRELEYWSRRALSLCGGALVALGAVGCPALADDPYVVVDSLAGAGGSVAAAGGTLLAGAGGTVAQGGTNGGGTGGGTGGATGGGPAVCGDGVVQDTERCDPGTSTSAACTSDCAVDCLLFHASASAFTLASGATHCYVVQTTSRNWEEAEIACEALGGHLVTIVSDAEQAHVEGLVTGETAATEFWIGATDYKLPNDSTFGPYTWVQTNAGDIEPWGYEPPGGFAQDAACNPDTAGGNCQHCLYTAEAVVCSSDQFCDLLCTTPLASICEWSAPGW